MADGGKVGREMRGFEGCVGGVVEQFLEMVGREVRGFEEW